MRELASKLRGQTQISAAQNTAIFGSLGTLAQALEVSTTRLRVGIWPILSRSEPPAAMGIAVILSYLLERWPQLRTYRLLAKLEGEPEPYHWTMERSQFGVDDWELEGLDENVALWGHLEIQATGGKLTLEVENDLAPVDDDLRSFIIEGQDLTDVVTQLPATAEAIIDYLQLSESEPLVPSYQVAQWDKLKLKAFLSAIFQWELNLLLILWGKPWPETAIQTAHEELVEIGQSLGDLGAWVVARATARGLLPLYPSVNETLFPTVEDTALRFEEAEAPSIFLALALNRLGERLRALDLLEIAAENHPMSAAIWITLAELYWQAGDLGAAIDTFQRGIEAGVESPLLYTRYADLLLNLNASGIRFHVGARRSSISGRTFVEGFVLIDPEPTQKNPLMWEAVEAYRACLDIKPDDTETLAQLVLQLIELGDGQIWPNFERLVKLDKEGERTRTVVDSFYLLDDIVPGIRILESAVRQFPDRTGIRLALTSAYLADEQFERAEAQLETLRQVTGSKAVSADIDRLMLSVENPEFEAHLGEITDIIDAGNEASADDVEFLEATIEAAPYFSTAYLLLARAYLSWGETDDALETLLDGQKHLPDDPDIIALLARVLWDAGETKLSFDYLNKGLLANPLHVPLLALTGRYLFEDGQDEASKVFLARAEALDPNNPVLREVRAFIARGVS